MNDPLDGLDEIARQRILDAIERERRAATAREQRRLANQARHAAEHPAELERQRLEAKANKEARQAEHAIATAPQRMTSDEAFIIDMAARRGMTPDEFRELQAQRRHEMANLPSYEEQLKTVPIVGGRHRKGDGE